MFDIGFVELLLVAVVGLLVLGPDKLPTAIRTCIVWWKRVKNSFESAKQQVQEEINYSEMNRQFDTYAESAKQIGEEINSIEDIDLFNEKQGQKAASKHTKSTTKSTVSTKRSTKKKPESNAIAASTQKRGAAKTPRKTSP